MESSVFTWGGIGIRKITDSAIPGYFSSLFKSRDLSNNILRNFKIDIFSDNISQILQQLDSSFIPVNDENKKIQKQWDNLVTDKVFKDLMLASNLIDRVRLLASSQTESSKWLQVVPSLQLGLFQRVLQER